MKRIWALALACGIVLAGCTPSLPQFGMRSEDIRPKPGETGSEGDPTRFKEIAGYRWTPRTVRFAPDDSHLLLSMCHVYIYQYCRIAKYHFVDKRWEVLPHEEYKSYLWPSYSPDGKQVLLTLGRCLRDYTCPNGAFHLARMPAEGGEPEILTKEVTGEKATYSPDGKRVLFWGRRKNPIQHVFELDLETRQFKQLTNILFDRTESGPQYFPDGKRFMFSASHDLYEKELIPYGHNRLMISTTDQLIDRRPVPFGGLAQAENLAYTNAITISPDGRNILANYGGNWLVLLDLNEPEKRPRVVYASFMHIQDAVLSSSGKHVAIARTGHPGDRNGDHPMLALIEIASGTSPGISRTTQNRHGIGIADGTLEDIPYPKVIEGLN